MKSHNPFYNKDFLFVISEIYMTWPIRLCAIDNIGIVTKKNKYVGQYIF